ncbi:MAG: ribonuclease HI family protein [Patescibacteria group bacterium]|jgi:probable phosphoglycerate mutase
MENVHIFSDGGSRGNPGPAACGAVVLSATGTVLKEISIHLGVMTNNQAEYHGLIAALDAAKALGAKTVTAFLDSELVVKQMRREYKVKHPDLQPLFLKAWNAAVGFERVTYTHVPRERNAHADALVNKALDKVDER